MNLLNLAVLLTSIKSITNLARQTFDIDKLEFMEASLFQYED